MIKKEHRLQNRRIRNQFANQRIELIEKVENILICKAKIALNPICDIDPVSGKQLLNPAMSTAIILNKYFNAKK